MSELSPDLAAEAKQYQYAAVIGNDPREELLAGIRDGEWLSRQEFEPPSYAVDGLIVEGFTLLVGPPKVGKSFLTLGLMLAVASGGKALSRINFEEPREVLYVALEDGEQRIQSRCHALLGGRGYPSGIPLHDQAAEG